MELNQKNREYLEQLLLPNLITFKNDAGQTVNVFAEDFVSSSLASLIYKLTLARQALTSAINDPSIHKDILQAALDMTAPEANMSTGEEIKAGDTVEVEGEVTTVESTQSVQYVRLSSGATVMVGIRNMMLDIEGVKKL
jgi:hypothetical protein